MRSPVHVLAAGEFGGSVADRLGRLRDDVVATSLDDGPLQPAAWPAARMWVLAAWRPVPSVCELLDRRCHEERRPFVPLVADAAVLRLGPIVVPGHGSCWGCWLRRFKQHAQWPAQRAALLQHYAARPDAGPRGHLEPFALLAAARLSEVIDGLDASCELAGRLWQMDMLTRDVVTSVVVGVHDCPRCGLRRSPPLRTVEELRRSLAYLWDGERLG